MLEIVLDFDDMIVNEANVVPAVSGVQILNSKRLTENYRTIINIKQKKQTR